MSSARARRLGNLPSPAECITIRWEGQHRGRRNSGAFSGSERIVIIGTFRLRLFNFLLRGYLHVVVRSLLGGSKHRFLLSLTIFSVLAQRLRQRNQHLWRKKLCPRIQLVRLQGCEVIHQEASQDRVFFTLLAEYDIQQTLHRSRVNTEYNVWAPQKRV
jgi:hypothetical protein